MPDQKAAAVWTDPDTFATCLLALGLDRFGPNTNEDPNTSPIHWLPQTWKEEVQDECGVEIHERNVSRLMAACLLLQNPHEFYHSVNGFNDIVSGIASVWFEHDVWHPPTAEEVLWALIEIHMIRPPEDDDTFSPEIVRYVNMIARNEGFRKMPQAFETFGVATDPYVWKDGSDIDYSSDPDLQLAVEEASNEREADLDTDTAYRMGDLANRLDALPITKHDTTATHEIRRFAGRLANAAPEDGQDEE